MDKPQHIQVCTPQKNRLIILCLSYHTALLQARKLPGPLPERKPLVAADCWSKGLLVSLVESPWGLTHPQLLFTSLIWIVPGVPISMGQARPSIILFGPTLFNHALGFIQVTLWMHKYGKIWKKWKCYKSYSINFTPLPPNVSQWKCYNERTVRANSSSLFPAL